MQLKILHQNLDLAYKLVLKVVNDNKTHPREKPLDQVDDATGDSIVGRPLHV